MVTRWLLRPGALLILFLAAAFMISASNISGSISRTEGDLDADGVIEEYFLENGSLTVKEGPLLLWKSPEDWNVDSFALGDVDHDNQVNLVMSLWKEGSFSEIRPFWHSGEDNSYKNHLFVYELAENRFQPVWCSSDLDCPILSFTIRDDDGDGRAELIVKEGRYRKIAGERYGIEPGGPVRTAVWQWKEWGFSLENAIDLR